MNAQLNALHTFHNEMIMKIIESNRLVREAKETKQPAIAQVAKSNVIDWHKSPFKGSK